MLLIYHIIFFPIFPLSVQQNIFEMIDITTYFHQIFCSSFMNLYHLTILKVTIDNYKQYWSLNQTRKIFDFRILDF